MRESLLAEWKQLHGTELPPSVAKEAAAAQGELSVYRADDFAAARNVFEAAVVQSADSHGLLLWEPFAGVLPVRTLGNGDMLFLHAPRAAQPLAVPPTLVWNHERDLFVNASDEDLAEAEDGKALPRGDATPALRFAARSKYLIELLTRGRFSLDLYASFEHVPLDTNGTALFDNVRTWPPTALYAMWHLYFQGEDASLARVLEAAAQSEARWVRDSGALLEELLGGRDEVGALKGAKALRAEVSKIISDPQVTAKVQAARARANADRRLLQPVGGVTLVRDDAPATPLTPVTEATVGNRTVVMTEARPAQFRLVVRENGKALTAMAIKGTGGAPELEPSFAVVQTTPVPVLALWKRLDPKAWRAPFNGALSLYSIQSGRLALAANWELDVDRLETRDGALIARTPDGVGYRVVVDPAAALPAPQPALPPFPGKPAEPPASSQPEELDGDRLELTPTSLKLWRGKKLLFEEPMIEAYAMTVLPKRRMVAVLHLTFELRPFIDVFWVRKLEKKAKAGEGGCTWASFACDGMPVQLKSTDDTLYVHDGAQWIEIDQKPLVEVPSWIKSRGWVE